MLLRRGVATAAVLGMAGLLTVAGVSPAAAFILPPAPVSFPGAAVPAGSTMTPAQWNTFLKGHPELVPSKATAGAAAVKLGVKGVGGAATALSGFQIGTAIGSYTAASLGLPTSGDFFCDLGTLTGGGQCGNAVSPAYLANSDLGTAMPPGWTASPAVSARWAACGTSGTGGCTGAPVVVVESLVQMEAVPAFGVAGNVTARLITSPNPLPAGYYGTMFMRDTAGVNSVNLTARSSSGTGLVGVGVVPNSPTQKPPGYVPEAVVTAVPSTVDRYELAYGSTIIAKYYPVGHASRPPEHNPNPERAWRSSWTCTSGPGGTATSPAFFEGDATWPAVPQPSCTAGMVASLTVEQMTNGAGAVVYNWSLPAEVGAVATAYPDCAAATPCALQLERVTAPGATTTISCFSAPEACTEWWTETSAGTQAAEDSEYRCRYGPHSMPLSDCAVYSTAFKTGTYADPKTGEAPASTPAPEPADGCPPPFTWTSLVTPWWYFKGMTCALEWAFVPTQTQVTTQAIATQVQTKTPVPQLVSLAAAMEVPEVAAACLELSLPLSFVIGRDQPFLDSCGWSDPVSQMLRDHRGFLAAAVWVGCAAPLLWWAWRTYAPGATGAA